MSFTASAGLAAGIPSPPRPPAPPTVSGAAAIGARSKQAPAKPSPPDPAATVMFHLSIEGFNAGWWNSFDGLGMETAIEQREEGGNNLWVHQLPTRLKFSNVKLARPLNEHSHDLAVWFQSFVTKLKPTTASITAVQGFGKAAPIIAQWSLRDVVPVRWTGPSFNVDSPKMATETLEIAHQGFNDPIAKAKA